MTASLFDRLGGAETIDRLVDSFYANMDAFPHAKTIRAMHAPDLTDVKQVLKTYLTEWTGGPKLYSPVKGHPRLRQRHLGFSIGTEESAAWLSCMTAALEATVGDRVAREEIGAALAKLADWMRNQPGNPHDSQNARTN